MLRPAAALLPFALVLIGMRCHAQYKGDDISGLLGLQSGTKKSTDIDVGDMATIQGGVGRTFYRRVSGPIPEIFNLGLDYFAQFQVTGDSGSDIPPALRGFKDRVFGLGPEFNVFFPKPRITMLIRYQPEFGARVRTRSDRGFRAGVGGEVAGQTAAPARPALGISTLVSGRGRKRRPAGDQLVTAIVAT